MNIVQDTYSSKARPSWKTARAPGNDTLRCVPNTGGRLLTPGRGQGPCQAADPEQAHMSPVARATKSDPLLAALISHTWKTPSARPHLLVSTQPPSPPLVISSTNTWGPSSCLVYSKNSLDDVLPGNGEGLRKTRSGRSCSVHPSPQ